MFNLRRKTTASGKREITQQLPPTLPPLILSSSLLPPAVALPQLPPCPPPEYLSLDDLWDPWKAVVEVTNPPLLAPNILGPLPVATASSPRHIIPQTLPQDVYPKTDALGNQRLSQKPSSPPSSSIPSPPAVVRGQISQPSSSFDFEESLSAANVTSVVNQFRSYPSPIRHHTLPIPPSTPSQMAIHSPFSSNLHRHHSSPQKPGSSSSLSSSSHNTDATPRTDGSCGTSTSASSLSPATEVIDPGGRLDPVGSSFSNSQPLGNVRTRSSSVDYNSRPLTTSRVTRNAPPTSFNHSLARQSSHSSLRPAMLFDKFRSTDPARKGPLIFAAIKTTPTNPYPSPPTEYASLESSPPSRNSVTASIFRGGAPQIDLQVQHGLGFSPTLQSTELPSLNRKSSKSSLVRAVGTSSTRGDDHFQSRPRVLTKARPSTPQKPGTSTPHKVLPVTGDPLLLDEDPFARVQGVKVVTHRLRSCSRSESSSSNSQHMNKDDAFSSEDGHVPPVPKAPLTPLSSNDVTMIPDTPPSSNPEACLPTPVTPDDYKTARQQRRGQWLEKAPPAAVAEIVTKMEEEAEQVEDPPREPTPPPTYFPIMAFLSNADLLSELLSYLSYSEWLPLYSTNKQVGDVFQSRILREFVLERYLSTVGYSKWNYEWAEPLALSLKDLHNYLRGVAMPTHEYARLSAAYLQPKIANGDAPMTPDTPDILSLALTTRAYTRVVLRLRAQAESEARYLKTLSESGQALNNSHPGTRQPSVSSRAPSPTSSYSHSHSRNHSRGKNEHSPRSSSSSQSKFRSPLYRPGRAPVLRTFVPSPEGDWLSDASVVECEAELKRSGVLKLLRVGDVVWDAAVGDEGNLGRLIWDGSYLVDLDYRYSRMGELSPYFHSLAFSPSYFHRVIRIGGSATYNPHCNPLVYIDVSPWGRDIAANLQLLQDRARTETPHGALHDVVRWVHRSTFTIRPPGLPSHGPTHSRSRALRVPIANSDGFFIDPGWYGTVVLESEGTNEGLADLQARCGPGVFPPRAETIATKIRNQKEKENRRVWRILREKSRPGEIWLRAVQVRERMM